MCLELKIEFLPDYREFSFWASNKSIPLPIQFAAIRAVYLDSEDPPRGHGSNWILDEKMFERAYELKSHLDIPQRDANSFPGHQR
jgi:hypothetical protein